MTEASASLDRVVAARTKLTNLRAEILDLPVFKETEKASKELGAILAERSVRLTLGEKIRGALAPLGIQKIVFRDWERCHCGKDLGEIRAAGETFCGKCPPYRQPHPLPLTIHRIWLEVKFDHDKVDLEVEPQKIGVALERALPREVTPLLVVDLHANGCCHVCDIVSLRHGIFGTTVVEALKTPSRAENSHGISV